MAVIVTMVRTLLCVVLVVTVSGCVTASGGTIMSPAALSALTFPHIAPFGDSIVTRGPSCGDCEVVANPLPAEITTAIESRLSELKQRGGACSRYGEVLEKSYRSGRISIRPYMWRVGDRLASGEAKPTGEMTLAREIDPLNIGLRTVDDLVWSMEHEAVHIAFNITTGVENGEDRANPYVRACRSDARSTEPGSR